MIDNLTKAKESQSRFYNKNRRVDVKYEPGDLVWLSCRHIKTCRPNSKLDVRRLEPFLVRRMVGKNAAELKLPSTYSRLHPVFNVSLLMPYNGPEDPSPAKFIESPGTLMNDFVDWAATAYILDYRCVTNNTHEYLIQGTDSSSLNDEWKLLTTLSPHIDLFLQQFHRITPSRGARPTNSVWKHRADSLV